MQAQEEQTDGRDELKATCQRWRPVAAVRGTPVDADSMRIARVVVLHITPVVELLGRARPVDADHVRVQVEVVVLDAGLMVRIVAHLQLPLARVQAVGIVVGVALHTGEGGD